MEEVDDRVCCSNTRQTYLNIHWAALSPLFLKRIQLPLTQITPTYVPTLLKLIFTTISNFISYEIYSNEY